MNQAALIEQVRGMIAQNPIDVGFIPNGSNSVTQIVSGGEALIRMSEKMTVAGNQEHAEKFIWTIKTDWTTLPGKRDKLSIGGEIYRVLEFVDYYMGTVRRFSLGTEFDNGGEGYR